MTIANTTTVTTLQMMKRGRRTGSLKPSVILNYRVPLNPGVRRGGLVGDSNVQVALQAEPVLGVVERAQHVVVLGAMRVVARRRTGQPLAGVNVQEVRSHRVVLPGRLLPKVEWHLKQTSGLRLSNSGSFAEPCGV